MGFVPTKRQQEAIRLLKEPATYFLLQGGSRSGKTTLIIYWCLHIALRYPKARILIARLHLSDLKRSIVFDTLMKVSDMMSEDLGKYVFNNFNKQEYFLRFPNGSELWFGGLSDKQRTEKILGTEYCIIFLSEVSQISYESYEMLVTRLAKNVKGLRNRFFMDCNPSSKSHWAYSLFFKNQDPLDKTPKKKENYVTLLLNPEHNPHLGGNYIELMENLSNRQKARFKKGLWLDDIEGALWKQELIDANRIHEEDIPLDTYERIVLGIDPAVTAKKNSSNETGLVVSGLKKGIGYVISDASGIYTPDGWGQKAVYLHNYYKVDTIVAETNQGGDLVVSNLTHINPCIHVKKIHAKRGKVLRADPIVGLYERGKVKHAGCFPKMEEQMTTWVPETTNESPDRVDALVYSIQELMSRQNIPRIRRI